MLKHVMHADSGFLSQSSRSGKGESLEKKEKETRSTSVPGEPAEEPDSVASVDLTSKFLCFSNADDRLPPGKQGSSPLGHKLIDQESGRLFFNGKIVGSGVFHGTKYVCEMPQFNELFVAYIRNDGVYTALIRKKPLSELKPWCADSTEFHITDSDIRSDLINQYTINSIERIKKQDVRRVIAEALTHPGLEFHCETSHTNVSFTEEEKLRFRWLENRGNGKCWHFKLRGEVNLRFSSSGDCPDGHYLPLEFEMFADEAFDIYFKSVSYLGNKYINHNFEIETAEESVTPFGFVKREANLKEKISSSQSAPEGPVAVGCCTIC